MSKQIHRKAHSVLLEMSGSRGQDLLEGIDDLTELLEQKPDANTKDLFLLQSICQVSQDLQILKEALKQYSSDFGTASQSAGQKLSQLLESREQSFGILN